MGHVCYSITFAAGLSFILEKGAGMSLKIAAAMLCLLLAVPLLAQEFSARHEHSKGYCMGAITITPNGISYAQSGGEQIIGEKRHTFSWTFEDIEQLEISTTALHIFIAEERMFFTGGNRELRFSGDFARAYLRLKDRMDQRLIARLADDQVEPLWTIPVLRLGRAKGSQGELLIGAERLVFKAAAKELSRTWRYTDIEGISASGPFELSIASIGQTKTSYRSSRVYSFQLKQALSKARYEELLQRLDRKQNQRRQESARD
jgi:hypothetical protein